MSIQALGLVRSHFPMPAQLAGFCMFLADMTNSQTGECRPSQDYLAEQFCCHKDTIKRYLREAEQRGIIRREYQFEEGRQTTTQIAFLPPRRCTDTPPEGCTDTPPEGCTGAPQNQDLGNGNNNSHARARAREADLRWQTFWENYPKKVGKKPAEKAFRRLTKTRQQTAIAHLHGDPFHGKNKQYIPNPATFIHQERWEDEADGGGAPEEDWRAGIDPDILSYVDGGGDAADH